ALAQISLVILEQPVRQRRLFTGRTPLWLAPLTAIAILTTTITSQRTPDASQNIVFALDDQPALPSENLGSPAVTTPPTTLLDPTAGLPPPPQGALPVPLRPGERPRLLIEGDSGAFTLGVGILFWARQGDPLSVFNAGKLGCGITRGGELRYVGKERSTLPECDNWVDRFTADTKGLRPHVVAVMVGTWDVVDRRLPGDTEWRAPGDPVYDAYLAREIAEATDVLAANGATVVWMTHPHIKAGIKEGRPGPFPENDPARMDRLNDIVREVVPTRPGGRVLDLQAIMRARPQGELDLAERPDGIHWSEASGMAAAEWLGPMLIEFARTHSVH
ncbi:DUF459 domain-containing protein, partial [Rhabdothermincola sediminis]|uniref:DUF459 domain-containing protein n=1 Tax=Rhabdothermincola sediminis TaxID=2751370 RepID=UPI001AA016A8